MNYQVTIVNESNPYDSKKFPVFKADNKDDILNEFYNTCRVRGYAFDYAQREPRVMLPNGQNFRVLVNEVYTDDSTHRLVAEMINFIDKDYTQKRK